MLYPSAAFQEVTRAMVDIPSGLTIAAVALNGILAGASLDQCIKQLPARRRIGAVAYSVYSRASDLGNGVVWYAGLGVGAALVTIAAAVAAYFQGIGLGQSVPVYAAALLSVLHTLVTTRAAPLIFSQRRYATEAESEAALRSLFDHFARLQALRAFLQVLTFGTLLWAMGA
jgi:hypothetical protein